MITAIENTRIGFESVSSLIGRYSYHYFITYIRIWHRYFFLLRNWMFSFMRLLEYIWISLSLPSLYVQSFSHNNKWSYRHHHHHRHQAWVESQKGERTRQAIMWKGFFLERIIFQHRNSYFSTEFSFFSTKFKALDLFTNRLMRWQSNFKSFQHKIVNCSTKSNSSSISLWQMFVIKILLINW